MKRTSILALCLVLAVFGVSAAFAVDGGNGPVATNHEGPLKYADQNGNQISKVYSGVNNGLAKAGSDTFYIYGGPASFTNANTHASPSPWPDGMFQTFLAGGSPQLQGWTSEDLTEPPVHWHGSTVNGGSTMLGVAVDSLFPDPGTGNPNQVVAAHHEPASAVDYTGYGNLWKDWLILDFDMSTTSHTSGADATVQFTAYYKADLESCCDFLTFEWYSADSGWNTVAALDVSTYGLDNQGTPALAVQGSLLRFERSCAGRCLRRNRLSHG